MSQRSWTGSWAGGRTFVDAKGRTRWALERMVSGTQFNKTLDSRDKDNALAELALFERDPLRYTTRKQARAAAGENALVVEPSTVELVVAHLKAEDATSKHIKNVVSYLGKWAADLDGIDLRSFQLKDLLKILSKHKTAKAKRIAALKTFTRYFREVVATLPANEDPTIALQTPPARPEKATREKGYTIELIERVYAAIYNWEDDDSAPYDNGDGKQRTRKLGANLKGLRKGAGDPQAIRDVLVLRSKYGMHGTEINRIATGTGVLEPVKGHPVIKGTLKFKHKSGRPHVLAADAQGFAAALRLQARGTEISDAYLATSIKYACRKLGVEPINPSELRHSFATWCGEVGVEVRPKEGGVSMEATAAVMGHLSKRTTGLFYWGVKVPAMIQIPIKLEHREDPRLA